MKKSYLLIALVSLTGCSSYSETFDCPAGQGVGCKSLSRVNQMVEKGHLPYSEREPGDMNDAIRPRMIKTDQADPLHLNADLMGAPVMYASAPKTNRIWFAGHKDERGHYHEGHYLEAASKPQEG